MTLAEHFYSLKYGYVADNKIDANGDEHSGANGRFVEKSNKDETGKSTTKKKPLKVVSKSELHDFIAKHRNSKDDERVSLGEVDNKAKARIKAATGIDVERVILDSDSVRHAFDPKHNLDPDDLDDMKSIIETTTDISLSPEKTRKGCPVIIFKSQEPNGVILCEEYRAKNKELELQTAYRKKKQRLNADSRPLAYAQDEAAYNQNINHHISDVNSLMGLYKMLKRA